MLVLPVLTTPETGAMNFHFKFQLMSFSLQRILNRSNSGDVNLLAPKRGLLKKTARSQSLCVMQFIASFSTFISAVSAFKFLKYLSRGNSHWRGTTLFLMSRNVIEVNCSRFCPHYLCYLTPENIIICHCF